MVFLRTAALVSVVCLGCRGGEAPAVAPRPEDPGEAIASALDSVWIVAIGENHGHADFHEWLIALLETPRIQRVVDDIAVEFGNAFYQGVMDRYILGEPVRYDSVKLAWRNSVVSPNTVWDSPVYESFFREVARINAERSDGRSYRVVLADSPVDWSSVSSVDDVRPYFDRAASMVAAIESEVLSTGRRALLIAGGAHLTRRNMTRQNRAGVPTAERSVVSRLQQRHPGAAFVIRSLGRGRALDHDRLSGVPRGSLLRVRGTWLGRISANELSSMRNMDGSPFTAYGTATLEDLVDAVIYWGDESDNRFLDPEPDTYREEAYWSELNRRSELMRGQPMDLRLRQDPATP